MYCAIGQYLSVENVGGSVWDCLQYLTNHKPGINKKTGLPYVTANASNLRVIVSDRGIYITGSLAKFLLGTNLLTLTRSDTIRAFEMMADTLHLPIQKAKVTKIEAGHNIITDFKPERYYPFLVHSKGYKRFPLPESLMFTKAGKKVIAYDKIAECENSKTSIPEVYAGKNVLRFEFNYAARLPKLFNIAIITPDTLTDERFYMGIYDCWHNEYESIEKAGLFNMDIRKLNTPKDYLDEFLAACILEKGLDHVLNHIEALRELKVYKQTEYYSTLKRKIINMVSTKDTVEQPELIQELNKKVARAKQNYR